MEKHTEKQMKKREKKKLEIIFSVPESKKETIFLNGNWAPEKRFEIRKYFETSEMIMILFKNFKKNIKNEFRT